MQPNNTQVNTPQMPQPTQPQMGGQVPPGNQAMANLGFVNTMQEHLLKYKAKKAQMSAQQPQNSPQNAPQQEQIPNPKSELDSMETRLIGEISALKDLINKPKDKIKKEISSIRQELEQLLQEEHDEND